MSGSIPDVPSKKLGSLDFQQRPVNSGYADGAWFTPKERDERHYSTMARIIWIVVLFLGLPAGLYFALNDALTDQQSKW
jgi:hypothetical protein